MHFVKQFNINGVDTKQVACIELQGKPNAATEGAVGLLGIDMSSPLHEVYKCVAVNGSIYTWELLTNGLSILAATISGGGEEVVQFPYSNLKIPSGYVAKKGDLIIDSDGYLYQVSAIDVSSCSATYCNMAFTKGVPGDPGLTPYVGDNGNWWIGDVDTGERASQQMASGRVATVSRTEYDDPDDPDSSSYTYVSISLALDFTPKHIVFVHRSAKVTLTWMDGRYVLIRDTNGIQMASGDAVFANGVLKIEIRTYLSLGEYSYIAMA